MTIGVVFDLDDTLYLERDYVQSGFAAVAAFVANSDEAQTARFLAYLWESFERGIRGRNFDLFVERYPDLGQRFTVPQLVTVYRQHRPAITPLPGAEALIDALRARAIPLGLISDGPVAGQSAKLEALGLERSLEVVIFTDQWGIAYRKPHPRAFIDIERLMNHARPLVYIADNPAKDFVAPKRRGWPTIRIRLDGQLHRDIEATEPAAAPDFDLRGFEQVMSMLEGM
jgi:putative hydrolase of the HAD superfamily